MAEVILQAEFHCNGCALKVKRAIKDVKGVKKVDINRSNTRMRVNGNVDPSQLKELVEAKTKKEVEIISVELASQVQIQVSTVDMKVNLHRNSLIRKIKKQIEKIQGVEAVNFDGAKDLFNVRGTMDAKRMSAHLELKLKRNVEVIQPEKNDEGQVTQSENDDDDDRKEGIRPEKAENGGRERGKKGNSHDSDDKEMKEKGNECNREKKEIGGDDDEGSSSRRVNKESSGDTDRGGGERRRVRMAMATDRDNEGSREKKGNGNKHDGEKATGGDEGEGCRGRKVNMEESGESGRGGGGAKKAKDGDLSDDDALTLEEIGNRALIENLIYSGQGSTDLKALLNKLGIQIDRGSDRNMNTINGEPRKESAVESSRSRDNNRAFVKENGAAIGKGSGSKTQVKGKCVETGNIQVKIPRELKMEKRVESSKSGEERIANRSDDDYAKLPKKDFCKSTRSEKVEDMSSKHVKLEKSLMEKSIRDRGKGVCSCQKPTKESQVDNCGSSDDDERVLNIEKDGNNRRQPMKEKSMDKGKGAEISKESLMKVHGLDKRVLNKYLGKKKVVDKDESGDDVSISRKKNNGDTEEGDDDEVLKQRQKKKDGENEYIDFLRALAGKKGVEINKIIEVARALMEEKDALNKRNETVLRKENDNTSDDDESANDDHKKEVLTMKRSVYSSKKDGAGSKPKRVDSSNGGYRDRVLSKGVGRPMMEKEVDSDESDYDNYRDEVLMMKRRSMDRSQKIRVDSRKPLRTKEKITDNNGSDEEEMEEKMDVGKHKLIAKKKRKEEKRLHPEEEEAASPVREPNYVYYYPQNAYSIGIEHAFSDENPNACSII